MKSRKSRILNFFICVSLGVVVVGFLFFTTSPKALAQSFRELNLWWILGAAGCIGAYWMLESVALHVLLKKMDNARRYGDSFKVAMGGHYFNAVTPFSTGGQPFQAYCLTRQGMSVENAAAGLLGRFVMYQTALVFVSTVLLIAKLAYFLEKVPNFAMVVLVGYLVNLGVLIGLVTIGWFRGVAEFFARLAIRIGAKIRLVKDPAKKLADMEERMQRFHANFRILIKHKGAMAMGFVLSCLQLTAYLAVPWFIYKAFSLTGSDPLTLMGAQGFVMMISSFIPIPGAAGGAEGSFYFFFKDVFLDRVAVAMVLWRLITFYLTVIVGAVFALQTEDKKDKKGGPEAHEDRSVQ